MMNKYLLRICAAFVLMAMSVGLFTAFGSGVVDSQVDFHPSQQFAVDVDAGSVVVLADPGVIRPNSELAILPFDDVVAPAPDFLTLTHLLSLRRTCLALSTDEAVTVLDNVFTNMAYYESKRLYAKHGMHLIRPFMGSMGAGLCGLVEKTVLNLSGMGPFVKHFRALTGMQLSTKNQMAAGLALTLPEGVLKVLGAVPNCINSQLVGPYLVAPRFASVVDQIKIGQLIRMQIFQKVLDYLAVHQQELIGRVQVRLEKLTAELETLKEEAVGPQLKILLEEIEEKQKEIDVKYNAEYASKGWFKRALDKTETIELQALRADLKTLLERQAALNAKLSKIDELTEQIKNHGESIARCLTQIADASHNGQELALQNNNNASPYIALLREIEIDGFLFSDYMDRCPHLEPGRFSSYISSGLKLVNLQDAAHRVLQASLYWSGTLDALHSLKEHLKPELLRVALLNTALNINKRMDKGFTNQVTNTSLKVVMRTALQSGPHLVRSLSNKPLVEAVNDGFNAIGDAAQDVVIEEVQTVFKPLIDHGRLLHGDANDVITGVKIISKPAYVVIYTASYTTLIFAGTYFLEIGSGLVGSEWDLGLGFTKTVGVALVLAVTGELFN
jgi:hypothetical protein